LAREGSKETQLAGCRTGERSDKPNPGEGHRAAPWLRANLKGSFSVGSLLRGGSVGDPAKAVTAETKEVLKSKSFKKGEKVIHTRKSSCRKGRG